MGGCSCTAGVFVPHIVLYANMAYNNGTMSPLFKSDDGPERHAAKIRDRAQYRPTAEQKELLVRAASLTGQSLSDFMRTAVEERARRVIADHERIVLAGQARETFLAALARPPKANDRLVSLMERYAREVTSRP
jgi:uncharacterized protein (DUF1778 family)